MAAPSPGNAITQNALKSLAAALDPSGGVSVMRLPDRMTADPNAGAASTAQERQ